LTFKSDLRAGKRAEKIVKNLLENSGFSVSDIDQKGKNAYKDMEVKFEGKNGVTTAGIEVKFDRLAQFTQNFCLEYHNPKKDTPSNISITSSLLYIYVIPDGSNLNVWVTSVLILKKFMSENKPYKDLKKVGDGNASVYLYKLDDILPIFKRIDNLNPKQVKVTLAKFLGEGKIK